MGSEEASSRALTPPPRTSKSRSAKRSQSRSTARSSNRWSGGARSATPTRTGADQAVIDPRRAKKAEAKGNTHSQPTGGPRRDQSHGQTKRPDPSHHQSPSSQKIRHATSGPSILRRSGRQQTAIPFTKTGLGPGHRGRGGRPSFPKPFTQRIPRAQRQRQKRERK